MELKKVIQERRSIRLFLPDPVPRDIITRLVDLSRWAPSWGNTQPWEIVVADGEKARELAESFAAEGKKGTPPRPDLSIPREFPPLHQQRYTGLGRDLLTFLGIAREDKQARLQHYRNMYRFFGAPAVIYLLIDGALNEPYSCLDIGSFGTTLAYGAVQEGLGTIYLAASMHFPDIIRRVLNIPEGKKVVIGLAIGYPHPTAPASVFRSGRVPVAEILRFA